MEERRMRVEDNPQGKLYEQLLGMVYRQHRYRNPVIGYASDIRKITATEVESFRKIYYVPSNIVLSVVGSVDPDRDIKTIERYFSRLPVGERRFEWRSHTKPAAYIAYRKPNYPHQDDPALSLFTQIFAESKLSPLYEELVKRRKVAAEIGSEEAPGSAYPNFVLYSLVPRAPHTAQDAVAAFDRVLERFLEKPPSVESLEMARRALAVQYLGHMKSNTSLALDFASSELMYNNWKALIDWYDATMNVTPEEIQQVGKRYFTRENRTIGSIVFDKRE
jgi:predicted Zn-dependent peptidase